MRENYKIRLGMLTAIILSIFALLSLIAYSQSAKIDICHKTGDGFNEIEINENAFDAHFEHGDVYPVPPDGCDSLELDNVNDTTNETDEINDTDDEINDTDDTNQTNETDDQNTNQTSDNFGINLHILQWYPKGPDYVFVCDVTGFEPTSYTWHYGDGHKLIDIENQNTYHVYESFGTFVVNCSATDGTNTVSDTLTITVDNLTRPVNPLFGNVTQGCVMQTQNITTCNTVETQVCVNQTLNTTVVNDTQTNQTNATVNQTNQTNTTNNQTNVTQPLNLAANLSGAQEVPPTNSTATGDATAIIENDSLIVSGSFAGLSSDLHVVGSSSAHIHIGMPGENGAVAFSLDVNVGGDNRSGFFTLPPTALTQEQIQDFANGNYYINVHTVDFPEGEIRGQLAP